MKTLSNSDLERPRGLVKSLRRRSRGWALKGRPDGGGGADLIPVGVYRGWGGMRAGLPQPSFISKPITVLPGGRRWHIIHVTVVHLWSALTFLELCLERSWFTLKHTHHCWGVVKHRTPRVRNEALTSVNAVLTIKLLSGLVIVY